MELESLPITASTTEVYLQYANFLIAAITCVFSLYVSVTMVWWWRRLKPSRPVFRTFILDVGLAKAALFFWALTGIFQITVIGSMQPLITLPSRLIWLFVVIRQAWTTLKYYKHDDPPHGPLER